MNKKTEAEMEFPSIEDMSMVFGNFVDSIGELAKQPTFDSANPQIPSFIITCVIVSPRGHVSMVSNAPPHVANQALLWHLQHAHNTADVEYAGRPKKN